MSEPGTLLSCLERAAVSGEGVRFLDRSEECIVLYRDILERARTVAGGLAAMGVEPGSRVAVAAPTGPSFYDAFFGVLAAGAAPLSLPLPPRFGFSPRLRRGASRFRESRGSSPGSDRRRRPRSPPGSHRRRSRRAPRSASPVRRWRARLSRTGTALVGNHRVAQADSPHSPSTPRERARHPRFESWNAIRLTDTSTAVCPGFRSTTTWGSSARC